MKDIQIPNSETAIDRINYMTAAADDVEADYRYERTLSPEELDEERQTFADLSIDLQRLEIEKAELVAELNAKIKAKRNEATKSLTLIRTGRIEVVENVYLIADPVTRMIGTFNQFGTLLSERKMRKAEIAIHDRSLFHTSNAELKDGTND